MSAILAKKLGMTQTFLEDGSSARRPGSAPRPRPRACCRVYVDRARWATGATRRRDSRSWPGTASRTCSWCAARCPERARRSWRCAAMRDAPLLGAERRVKLDDAAFGARFHGSLVHQSVRAEQAARRSGTAATRTRGEVSGGGAKPWRQKGTDRKSVV